MSARLTTSLNFVGSKVICVVCRSTSTAKFLATVSPTCRFRSPTGDKPYPLHRGNLLLSYISPSTWGNQRRARSHYPLLRHQANFWRRCHGFRVQQDRGVAHYLLPLLFSLVSSPFSFYLSVLYRKSQKNCLYLLLLWVPLKTPSCVTSLVTTTITLSALLFPHLPLQLPLMKLNLLC